MRALSPQVKSQAISQNSEVYVEAGQFPWVNEQILLAAVLALSESPKADLNSFRKISRSFNRGESCSNRGVNQDKAEPVRRVPKSATWVSPVGYQSG